MVVDAQEQERHAEGQDVARLWCYLVALRGGLYAVPDEEHAVLLPYINYLSTVTPLPLGLVPAYVRGLINVGQNGEILIDLGAYLGLAGAPAPHDEQRLIVLSEGLTRVNRPRGSAGEYRLAFVVDGGYGLTTVEQEGQADGQDGLVRALVDTRHGQARLLDMEAICRDVVRALGAERPWNAAMEPQG